MKPTAKKAAIVIGILVVVWGILRQRKGGVDTATGEFDPGLGNYLNGGATGSVGTPVKVDPVRPTPAPPPRPITGPPAVEPGDYNPPPPPAAAPRNLWQVMRDSTNALWFRPAGTGVERRPDTRPDAGQAFVIGAGTAVSTSNPVAGVLAAVGGTIRTLFSDPGTTRQEEGWIPASSLTATQAGDFRGSVYADYIDYWRARSADRGATVTSAQGINYVQTGYTGTYVPTITAPAPTPPAPPSKQLPATIKSGVFT
jgi:hypothetical protein